MGPAVFEAIEASAATSRRSFARSACSCSNDEINRILLDADTPEAALVAAMRGVCESQRWESGQYWRLDEAEGVLRIHAGWSVDDERIAAVLRESLTLACGPGDGLVGEVLLTGQPVWVSDLRRDPRALRKNLSIEAGWTSALLAPVLWEGRVIGVLDFNARSIPEPDEQLLHVVRAVGLQIGNFFARTIAVDRLRESEAHYSSMVELAAIGISHVDLDGRFVHVNRRLCEMLGYTREELLELSIREISHPDDRFTTDTDRARLDAGEIDSFKAEKRYLRRDGTPIWVRLTRCREAQAGPPDAAPHLDRRGHLGPARGRGAHPVSRHPRRNDGAGESNDVRRVPRARHRAMPSTGPALRDHVCRSGSIQGHQ